jgi:hypothetical protein
MSKVYPKRYNEAEISKNGELIQRLMSKLTDAHVPWGVSQSILRKSVALRCADQLIKSLKTLDSSKDQDIVSTMSPSESELNPVALSTSAGGVTEKDVVTDVTTFFSTIGLVSALLLTITLPWLFTKLEPSEIVKFDQKLALFSNFYNCSTVPCEALGPEIAYKEALNIAFVAFIFLSTLMSLVSLLYSVLLQVHLTVCMVTTEDKLWFIENAKITAPRDYMLCGLAFLGISIPLGLVVVYGRIVCWICAFTLFVIVLRIRTFFRELCRLEFNRMEKTYLERADELQRLLNAPYLTSDQS